MESGIDFVKRLENDMVLNIFNCLDPADVVRACNVSPDWRDFVIGNEVSKQLCLREFPQVADIVDVHVTLPETTRKRKSIKIIWAADRERKRTDLILSRNHKVYASLLHLLRKLKSDPIDCKEKKLSVSNYPSKGLKDDHDIPKTLIFKLQHDQCVITEINIEPYREYLEGIQLAEEDYSAKSVRFRMGFPKPAATKKVIDALPDNMRGFESVPYLAWPPLRILDKPLPSIGPGDFIWTYTSPEFPINRPCQLLSQGGRGQQFKFAEPVLCIGGIVMIELLGRVQMDEQNAPYCVKIEDVQVLGRALSPAFEAKVEDDSGKFILSYDARRLEATLRKPPVRRFERNFRSRKVCACACSENIEL